MKKIISLIGIVSLSLLMSLGLLANQTSASSTSSSESTEETSQLAASRYVEYDRVYTGKIIPPNTYYYSDSYGYKGTLTLQFYLYSAENNKTSVRYAGTVYCNGVCVASETISE